MAEGLPRTWRVAMATLEGTNEQKTKSLVHCLKMSCRIDRIVGAEDIVALCISGRITRQDVDTLCRVIEDEASAVAIDLKNDLVDREVVKFLAQKEINGTVFETTLRISANGSRESERKQSKQVEM